MANKRQMIIDRLWQMKKAAQEIDVLCDGLYCVKCPAFGVLYGCKSESTARDMKIPEG